ncbi:MAG: maleylacetoacetate isomerase [Kordiimonadaceae bacterium]|nr:maleylacetoacetate isomerase [Kordiimonadaceae bacterium]
MRKLYSYFRSSAAYRVRVALAVKGLEYDYCAINLLPSVSGHKQLDYLALNPQGRVPFLIDGDVQLSQSPAILEYLEEQYPETPLLPENTADRAYVRQLMNIVACDIHPLQNSSVQGSLKRDYGLDADDVGRWNIRWISEGFKALEAVLSSSQHTGTYCFGDVLTLADVCLIPQMNNGRRYDVPMEEFPTLVRIDAACSELAPFIKAAPKNQPDAP